jgi:hypothetical protein
MVCNSRAPASVGATDWVVRARRREAQFRGGAGEAAFARQGQKGHQFAERIARH